MITIDVPAADLESGTLAPERQAAAIEALRVDGAVVLADVVDHDHLDLLHDRMISDLAALQARSDAPYNWVSGNIQQDPPPFEPYLFSDVLLNPYVIAVTAAVLGPGVKNVMYSGNTALPSESRQPVHADVGHLWPPDRLEAPHPPAQLVVNVPTVDVSAENGATEIWLGTHRVPGAGMGGDIEIGLDDIEARRRVSPPLQPTIRRGSVLIRDIRLWHAGMPNRTEHPRPMIAMVHTCGWLDVGTPLTFPASEKAFFDHPRLATAAQFTDDPVDHVSTPRGHGLADTDQRR